MAKLGKKSRAEAQRHKVHKDMDEPKGEQRALAASLWTLPTCARKENRAWRPQRSEDLASLVGCRLTLVMRIVPG